MSYKEKLKQSQGAGGNFLKLPVEKIYKLKDDGNVLKFSHYADEKDNFVEKLAGVLIGSAMKMEVFQSSYGKNGGSWNSTYYFTKQDRVIVFSPAGQRDFEGTAEDAEKFMFDTARANVKKRSCLFLATDSGLIEVQTNVTLTIAQMNTMRKENKDVFLDNVVLLTPAIYQAAHFGKEVHKIMKESIVAKNPPKYAMIELGAPITDETVESFELESLAETFVKWKEQINKKPVESDSVGSQLGAKEQQHIAEEVDSEWANTPE